MFDIIADLEGLKTSISVDINLKAVSKEELLIAWLDELLYNFYTKGIIFSTFEIASINEAEIIARSHGRLIGDNRNRLKREIKAATFHDLAIKEDSQGLSVEIIFDV